MATQFIDFLAKQLSIKNEARHISCSFSARLVQEALFSNVTIREIKTRSAVVHVLVRETYGTPLQGYHTLHSVYTPKINGREYACTLLHRKKERPIARAANRWINNAVFVRLIIFFFLRLENLDQLVSANFDIRVQRWSLKVFLNT